MVMCNMDSVVIPRPPAMPPLLGPITTTAIPLKIQKSQKPTDGPPRCPSPKRIINNTPMQNNSPSNHSIFSNRSNGFRLQEDQGDRESVYSVYKQKIDSMFDSDASASVKNSVQARIEKMFSDVAKDNGIDVSKAAVHSFSVDYLGSVPLQEKVTSLAGLQKPLRDLYFAYKRTTKVKKSLTGRLEISSQGLKVHYEGEKGDLEQMNSFPTIAVWSAVKFVIQDSSRQPSYAFLPLITDPDNIDKQSLFRTLDENEKKYISEEAHSPLFAVVMRKIGVHKQLECHGFVCQTSEDAIVIAATLYKSLMSHMKAKEKKPKNRNGITCISTASSVFNEKNGSIPVRPPRRKRSTASSIVSDFENFETSESQPLISPDQSKAPKKSVKAKKAPPAPPKADLDAIMPYEEVNAASKRNEAGKIRQNSEIKPKTFTDQINTFMSREQRQITEEIKQMMSESPNKGLKSVNKRNEGESQIPLAENTGDILTKVTIPRSGSFLNTAGLTRYKSKISRNNGQATGGSPLGFHELFNEFRLQEGLHSMDEILGVIIDPEGMSFNDLKPIYKEFLLKLSVTLTKDELYQRSKSIMRRHRKKQLKRTTSLQSKSPHRLLVGGKIKQLKHIFQRNLKLKLGPKSNQSGIKDQLVESLQDKNDGKLPESSISTSSYDTRQFRPREDVILTRKQSYRKKAGDFKKRREKASTSEESDFFSVGRRRKSHGVLPNNQNRNSSSGYVSCSDCSYDSESCTCVSADKCYCSLGNKDLPRKKSTRNDDYCCCSFSFCGCDTDSCAESNKCYCQNVTKNATILEQLKQRGFYPSAESMVSVPNHRRLCKSYSNTKSSKSLEYMHNPSEGYYEKFQSKATRMHNYPDNRVIYSNRQRKSASADNLALDYELFSATDGSVGDLQRKSLYARAFSESGHLGKIHREHSWRSYSDLKRNKAGRTIKSTSIAAGACTEALSVKKSAEIAALFADIKLSQTTDISHLTAGNLTSDNAALSQRPHKPRNFPKALHSCSKAEGISHHHNQRFVPNSYNSRNGSKVVHPRMYSTRNGLYTIQSQSDESRRSSVVSNRRKVGDREYFELEAPKCTSKNCPNNKNNLENSLGYLP